MTHLPHTVESLLDLFTVSQIQEAIEHQLKLNETEDDWEQRHLLAAEYLCNYGELMYPKQLAKHCDKLRTKLNLYGDN